MGRTHLAADIHWYCAPDGSDETGDGSMATPWFSPEKAHDFTRNEIDLRGFKVKTHILGKYDGQNGRPKAGPWAFSGPLVGAKDTSSFVVYGEDGVNAVLVGNNGVPIFQAFHNAMLSFTSMNLWPGAGSKGIENGLSECVAHDLYATTNGGTAIFSVADGRFTTSGNIMLSSGGNPLLHVCAAENNSKFYLGGYWSFNGAPGWSAFSYTGIGGATDYTGFIGFTGLHSGLKRRSTKSSVIHMNGLQDSAIPGTGDQILGSLE